MLVAVISLRSTSPVNHTVGGTGWGFSFFTSKHFDARVNKFLFTPSFPNKPEMQNTSFKRHVTDITYKFLHASVPGNDFKCNCSTVSPRQSGFLLVFISRSKRDATRGEEERKRGREEERKRGREEERRKREKWTSPYENLRGNFQLNATCCVISDPNLIDVQVVIAWGGRGEDWGGRGEDWGGRGEDWGGIRGEREKGSCI